MSPATQVASIPSGALKALSDAGIALRAFGASSGNPRIEGAVGLLTQNKDWLTVSGSTSVVGQPGTVEVRSITTVPLTNGSDQPTTTGFSHSVETTNSTTFDSSSSESVGLTVQSKFNIPFVGSSDVSVSANLDFSKSKSETSSVTRTWEIMHSATVPPHQTLKFTIVEKVGTFEGSWAYSYQADLSSAGVAGLRAHGLGGPTSRFLVDFFPGFVLPPAATASGPLTCDAALEVDVIDANGLSQTTRSPLVRLVVPRLRRSRTAQVVRRSRRAA